MTHRSRIPFPLSSVVVCFTKLLNLRGWRVNFPLTVVYNVHPRSLHPRLNVRGGVTSVGRSRLLSGLWKGEGSKKSSVHTRGPNSSSLSSTIESRSKRRSAERSRKTERSLSSSTSMTYGKGTPQTRLPRPRPYPRRTESPTMATWPRFLGWTRHSEIHSETFYNTDKDPVTVV